MLSLVHAEKSGLTCRTGSVDLTLMPETSAQRSRLTIPEYAMALAHVASLRSEDPFRKVGAVAFDFDNRCRQRFRQ